MRLLIKKHTIGFNSVLSENGVINAKGVKSKPNKLQISGYTHEIGTGEKSPDNPYILQSLDSGSIHVDGIEYEHSIIISNNDTTIQVPVPIALNSVEGVSDYIYKDSDGTWKLMQNNKKYEFIGNETVTLQSTNGYEIANFLYNIDDSVYLQTFLLCNMLKRQLTAIADTQEEGFLRTRTSSTRTKLLYFRLKIERASTVEEFKNFLAEQYENGTPLTIIYQLENPIVHTLSDYAQDLLNSFTLQNQNEISVEGYPDIKISGYIQK